MIDFCLEAFVSVRKNKTENGLTGSQLKLFYVDWYAVLFAFSLFKNICSLYILNNCMKIFRLHMVNIQAPDIR